MNDARLARQAVERAARQSYGRLVAFLARRSRDIEAIEDALSDAFASALTAWERDGVPEKPEAWLLRAASRRIIDAARHRSVIAERAGDLARLAEQALTMSETAPSFPDERLELLFACAHPAIDPAMHTPLMLQAVLGVDAATIASAFVVSPATMAQRLVRVKAKIREAGVRFETPGEDELDDRLDAVLQAIYAAYTARYDDVTVAEPVRTGLGVEAIELAGLVAGWLPEQAEALGLSSLLQFCEARAKARRGAAGEFVPLDEQETSLWQRPMIAAAEQTLMRAAALKSPGRFQYEAAIQSAHIHSRLSGRSDPHAVAALYEALIEHAPTLGALVGRASALAEAFGTDAATKALDEIPQDAIRDYQPAWALRADLLRRQSRWREAAAAYQRAIGLTEDPGVRAFLLERAALCERGEPGAESPRMDN